MAIEEQHVALPKLYGAPAYARPAPPVAGTPRPFDPDDLPLEAIQTPEERRLAELLPARTYLAGGAQLSPEGRGGTATATRPELNPRPLSLRSLAGRILRTGDS